MRAHQHAAGARGSRQEVEVLGRSRGGFTTKFHVAAEGNGMPLTLLLPLPERRVLVPAYGCLAGNVGRMAYGQEHTAVGSFGLDGLEEIDLPARYARAAGAWAGPTVPVSDDA